MKWRAGWIVSAGLALATTAASAATLAPTKAGRLSDGGAAIVNVSDFRGPYAALPEDGPMMPRYAGALLPPEEVYAVLRETGFSPLGIPRLRGAIYVIAAVDRSGDDGRLFIDARSGRILSFMPAYQMGENYREDLGSAYGAYDPQAAPPMPAMRGAPRPPASIPQVASRAAPMAPQPAPPVTIVMPKALPPAAAVRPPEPALPRAAAVEAKPLAAPAGPPAAAVPPPAAAPATVAQARPTPQILPTQAMPKAQDLEY
jgi:hypothetical protein